MTRRRLFSDSTSSRGRATAFDWASDRSGGSPRSVLYIEPPTVDDDVVADQWAAHGTPIELQCERFGTLVDGLVEADTYEGPTTHVTDAERRWLVEEALVRIDDTTHPLYTEGTPAVGLIEQSEELLTLLEFADAITENEVERRLAREGVPELGEQLSRFVALVREARADWFDDAKTFRSERFRHVLDAGRPLLETELAATDVVVVGAFQTLSALERDIVGLLADTVDTGVVMARVTDGSELSGADDAVRRICRWYDELGFTEPGPSDRETPSARETAAASLYRHDEGPADPIQIGSGLTLETHSTVHAEIREIARSVRSLIGSGVEPSAISVAPFDDATYGDRLADALRDADVPVSHTASQPFGTTITGRLFDAAIDLGSEPDRQDPLVRLLSNPLVVPDRREMTRDVLQTAELLESTRVSTLATHVDADTEALLSDVVTACERFVNATDTDAERRSLFDALGVPILESQGGFSDAVRFTRRVRRRERQATEKATEVCASLAERRAKTDGDNGGNSDVEAVRRGLEQVSVTTAVGRESDSVRICSPAEAAANPAEHVFIPGATTEHTPSPPRRLAFARPLNDAHPEFEAADPVAGTRYVFAGLVATDTELTISAPEHNPNGDPYVLADPLVELTRVTDLAVDSVDRAAEPATHTDVHRSLATAIDTEALGPSEVAENADAYDIDAPESNATDRLANGVRVTAARATDTVEEYDGHVDPAVVATLRDETEPFSPSRLETYADCGFKYYLKNVLEIEPDEEITLEVNALDAGTYVHDVLERFYREWTDRGHEGVTTETLDDAAQLLYTVAADRIAELDARDTVFHDTWVAALFDGLDVTENQYGDAEAAAGLFKRFLTAELSLAARDATPTYFEAHVGLDPEEPGPEVISTDPVQVPGTDATLRGKIDRLDVTPDGGLVGFDYKTGSTNSESDTIDGHAFQLPAYLLMAESALDGDPVGASYYQVNPAATVSTHAGTIGGEEDAAYHARADPEPLRRHYGLQFETRAEFQTFLHTTVPNRIERISIAVDNGSFHPTVLDPKTAGCEYCPYRAACDVRHHRRHAIHQSLAETNTPQYAPGLNTEGTR